MGCDCLKPEEIQKEIRTYTIEDKDNYIIIKTDKTKDIDAITSLKTSDKNTFRKNGIYNQPSKKDNNKIFFSSENKNEIISTSKNNSNDETAKKTIDNIINKVKNKNRNNQNMSKMRKKQKNSSNIKTKIISQDKNKSKSKIKLKKKIKIKKEMPKDDFSKYIYEHINGIRTDPKSFIPNIEEAKKFITRNKRNKLIYKKDIKVALSEGLVAFEEAISILNICKPMNKLIFDPNLMVRLPQNEEEMLNKNYFKNEIKKMIQKGIPINAYWRDIIKEKETSFLMMIVDDTGLKAGLKRKDILDPNMKYIGLCSTNIGKHFVCFMTFSNSEL